MSDTQQPEALQLAYALSGGKLIDDSTEWADTLHAAEAELLRQHARIAELEDVADMAIKRIAELEAQLSAIGAGGVEPLRKSAPAPAPNERAAFEKWLGIKPCGAAHDLAWSSWKARAALAATQPVAQGLDKVTLLSKDHTGMKVDYSGLLVQVRREIKRSAPGLAEMIRQLQKHMQELGQRWYAGDTAVVDELLQLYSVECQARDAIAAQAKQGGAA